MTKPAYPEGWPAGSQVRRAAWSPADKRWIVNFNNGNSNTINRNNRARVRLVRSVSPSPRECQSAAGTETVSFRSLYHAYQQARRGKKPSANQLAFESDWIGGLIDLHEQLSTGTWSPRSTTCFIATRPKTREIHAPDFADRIVHHWMIGHLEPEYERIFIHDSYANRKGKGSHAAVNQLRRFVRQVHSGQGGGWYLQLDIHNCFNAIDRRIVWSLIKGVMQRSRLPEAVQRTVHALLRQSPRSGGVRYAASLAQRALVPAHKRLVNALPGCGLAIGNLSSQFLADVYLNELDQFVKHSLKAKRYLRYVDDFVLVHHDRCQLRRWQHEIETFLHDRLRLRLKADIKLRPLTDGIDFLGYVVRPSHTKVRRRVVLHAEQALRAWERPRRRQRSIHATPRDLRAVANTWASYQGHFRHAASHRLRHRFHARFPWLAKLTGVRRRFHPALDDRAISFTIKNRQ